MYKNTFLIIAVLLFAIALSGCDVLFGSGDTDSKYGSSSSSTDSTGALNKDLFTITSPVNGGNINEASTHFVWNYSGDTSSIMYYVLYIEGSRIEITNIGGNFYDREIYHIISSPGGHQNNWYIEVVDTSWNILARSENFHFYCDASGGTNDMPTGINVSQYIYRDQIDINWNSPTDSAKMYKIYGECDGKKFVVATNSPWIHPFYHYGLLPDMAIDYAIASVDWNDKENLSGWYMGYTMAADFYPTIPFYPAADEFLAMGSRAYYKINVASTRQVYLKLYNLGFDGEFQIREVNGNHIHHQNSNFDNSDEEFNLSLEAGDYFIVVINNTAAGGNYRIDITD